MRVEGVNMFATAQNVNDLCSDSMTLYNFALQPQRMKNSLPYIIALVLAVLTPVVLFSQPLPPVGGLPPCGEPFGPACPIDGVSTFLIASGLIYGGKKALDAGRQKK